MSKTFCFVLPSFIRKGKGGSELQSFALAQELLQRGWEVHYIRENSRKIGEREIYKGVILHALPYRHTKLKWLNTKPLYSLMKTIRADVWYCRGTVSYVYPCWKNAKQVGGNVVWACSSDRVLTKKIQRELKRESLLRRVFSLFDRFLFRKALKKIPLVLLQNSHQQRLLGENFHRSGEILYNSQKIVPWMNTKREPLILWAGRLQDIKQPEKFSELVQALKERPYRFVSAGRKVEDIGMVEEFLETASEIPNFTYMGEIERDVLFQLYSKARLLVNTSRFEGFSNTFVEAWMFGVPVISLSVDPDDLIKRHGLGRISSNMDNLSRDVVELMEDNQMWTEMSRNCRKFAEKNFDIRDKVDQLEELIRNIV